MSRRDRQWMGARSFQRESVEGQSIQAGGSVIGPRNASAVWHGFRAWAEAAQGRGNRPRTGELSLPACGLISGPYASGEPDRRDTAGPDRRDDQQQGRTGWDESRGGCSRRTDAARRRERLGYDRDGSQGSLMVCGRAVRWKFDADCHDRTIVRRRVMKTRSTGGFCRGGIILQIKCPGSTERCDPKDSPLDKGPGRKEVR